MKINGSTGKRAIACFAAFIAMPVLLGFNDNTASEPATEIIDDANNENVDADNVNENIDADNVDDNVDGGNADGENIDGDNIGGDNIDGDNTGGDNTEEAEDTDDTDEDNISIPEPTASSTDALIREYMKRFDGQLVIDIEFEGASDETINTALAACLLRVGEVFSADIVVRDRNAIKNLGFFYDAYQTVRVIPEGVIVTVHLLENPVLRSVDITGNTIYPDRDLQKLVTVRRSSILNQNILHDNLAAIQEKYRDDGYILMKITDMHVDSAGVLHIKINEGTLEGYRVKGNTKTKDYVVLREMRQKVGEPFNAKLARRSMERVYNLGFFEDVNVKMLSGIEPNAIVMEVNVKEKRTGTFGIGAGYSTREGLLGVISISDTNFRGTGDAVSLAFETSADDEDAHGFSFSYRRPWLDSKETAGTLRIYNRTYQFYDYDTHGDLKERYMRKYTGGEVTLSRPISEYSTNYVTLRQRKDKYVRHVSDGNAGDRSGAAGAAWRAANFGTTRSIGLQHVTDTRDNIYNPTTGGRIAIGAEFSGILGGDFDFQKYNIEHQQFWKAGHAQVWAAKLAYGVGYGDLTEFNQFRVGGQNTLRGYRDDQFRGSHMTIGTMEYRFPLAKSVQGILFTDWGGAWASGFTPKGKDIYGSIGTGIALNTPLGPLRLDYGRGSQGGRFHFSVGRFHFSV